MAGFRIPTDNEKGERDVDDQGPPKVRRLRAPQYERLVRLMVLLQKRGSARTVDLLEELQVSERTLQRDIAALRSRGAQIATHWHHYRLERPRW